MYIIKLFGLKSLIMKFFNHWECSGFKDSASSIFCKTSPSFCTGSCSSTSLSVALVNEVTYVCVAEILGEGKVTISLANDMKDSFHLFLLNVRLLMLNSLAFGHSILTTKWTFGSLNTFYIPFCVFFNSRQSRRKLTSLVFPCNCLIFNLVRIIIYRSLYFSSDAQNLWVRLDPLFLIGILKNIRK